MGSVVVVIGNTARGLNILSTATRGGDNEHMVHHTPAARSVGISPSLSATLSSTPSSSHFAETTDPHNATRTEFRRNVRTVWLDILAILWPTQCLHCAAPDRELCDDCFTALRVNEGRWQHIATPAGVAFVAGPYDGQLRDVLVGFKHDGLTRFAKLLGAQLRGALVTALSEPSQPAPLSQPAQDTRPSRSVRGRRPALIVTVPSRPARVRERGYRHVDLIVKAALRGWLPHQRQLYLLPRALSTKRGRTGQVGLSSAGRMRNAARIRVNPMVRSRLRGRDVVLVDDIITTGATVAAAAHALEGAGANVIAIVAVCGTVRKDAQPSSEPQ